jgi:capsular exopolysaccharide synthesis family protein
MTESQTTPKDQSQLYLDGLYLADYPPQSRYAEAFRSLRTNLHFSFAEGEFQSILVTSAGPEEGKSTVAANLAYTLAKNEKRVLMIDADMRKPKLSSLRPELKKIGLSILLSTFFEVNIDSGTLSEFSTSDLLWIASFQKRTGVLHLTDKENKVNIYIKKGELWDVTWISRPEEKRLAAMLVKNHILSESQIEDAFLQQKNTKQQLGFILLSMGYIKEEDLSGYIKLHIIESLRQALQMRSGTFFFEKLPLAYFEKPRFNPPDLQKILQQVIIGEEEIPYLQKLVYSSIAKTPDETLFLMPCGPVPHNPAELLSTNQMLFLLSFLKRRFDFIVLDTPPVIPASDALILAPSADGVLLVARAGKTNRVFIKKAIEQIKMAKANLLGVVLNQIDFTRERYYKYYTKYYGKTS